MTKYKPNGWADYLAFDILEQAIEAAKRQMGANDEITIYAIRPVAIVNSKTQTTHEVTFKE